MRPLLAAFSLLALAACASPGATPDAAPPAGSQAASPMSLDPALGAERTLPCGPARLVVARDPTDEFHSIVLMRFRAADGAEVSPEKAFPGSFHSMCDQGRFLLVSDDPHFETAPSSLMTGDGKLVATLDLGFAPRVSVSRDHKLFWSQTHEGDGIAETRLRVFDTNGAQLLDKRYTTDGAMADVTLDGQTYRIAVAKPDLPG